ncbi:MAG: hypothetical protein V7629_16505 [Motiliproteus sp.]
MKDTQAWVTYVILESLVCSALWAENQHSLIELAVICPDKLICNDEGWRSVFLLYQLIFERGLIMGREYFLAETLCAADKAVAVLHQQLHINDKYIHIVSNDSEGLKQHHLHAANLIHKSDLVRGAELGVMVGLVASLFFFCLAAYAAPFLGMTASLKSFVIFSAALGPLFVGGTVGTLIGLCKENYKINPFHLDLELGHHLILVDSDQLDPIKRALVSCPVIDKGEGSTLILPFEEQATANNIAHFQTAA